MGCEMIELKLSEQILGGWNIVTMNRVAMEPVDHGSKR